ncbi:MAG: penicillin-binding protein 2 [Coriobacteriales bacterium]|jgi:penicillin-binding protein 2
MTAAVGAAIIVLLFIAAICLLVLVVRSGNKKSSRISLNKRSAKDLPTGVESLSGSEGEGGTMVRRRSFITMGIIGTALGVLAVKLWSMQVISGSSYSAKADANRITEYTTIAPRGRIFDRNGVELVGNRSTFAVLANSEVQDNREVVNRLSNVLGIPRQTVQQLAESESEGAQADRVIALDVDERAVAYISEHPSAFPGVSIEGRTVRTYPKGTLAAHVLGYTGTISESELANQSNGISYESGDIVGKDGAEQAFEAYLQGDRGVKRVEINAAGEVVSTVDSIDPVQGNDIRLTIDAKVQKVAEDALKRAFSDAHKAGYPNASAGAIVCMNAKTGEIIAMASYPTYNPAEFVNGISSDTWEEMTAEDSGYPLSNRCIAGQYPAASTFKGFTGLAGLQYGFATTSSVWDCKGTWTGFGKKWPQKCWNTSGHGLINFHNGIVESCDVVFYEIAKRFYNYDKNETALQDYLKSWGFGSKTGIELSGEAEGRVPTPEWKKKYNRDAPESQAWLPGDLSNLIIGQGDLLVTPLQICCGYAGLATGKVPKPVLLHSVLSSDDQSVVVDGATYRGNVVNPDFTQKNIKIMRSGFRGVVADGSVKSIFSGLGVKISGKTGTAEVAGKDNYGWFVGYGPSDDPEYVCACCIEEGGAGATCAAPAVRSVLAKALGKSSQHVSGSTTSER